MKLLNSIAAILLSLIIVCASQAVESDKSDNSQKSILVTGASTGIGRHLAETLASEGHHVYAGARKESDIAELNALENITAVRLDVTKQNEVDAVRQLIEKNGTGLYALVNNAGIFIGGEVASTDMADHRKLYEVNVEGVYRVSKAFIPLIIESKGRIATTGSIAGTITRAQMSAYSGTKHWMEAFTDALAAEMQASGVRLSVIQPGNYQTNIRRTSVLHQHNKLKAQGKAITPEMQKQYDDMAAYELSLNKPDDVSEAYMHALFDPNPLRRYIVTPNKEEHAFTIGDKIRQLVELNQWGEYRYTQAELLELVNKAIEGNGAN
ncbi:SDR family NAD(P)-dependent oxidoreductase [Ningiella sp. W23]|uniref:SDR family NAD(P)-dependent oxidoreductase n=1 Tax=Ningiella sp. W23 TaxID=3023715 RepID=UPI0037571E6D